MAEYNITVEILGVTLLSMTGEQIVQALQAYEAGSGTELIPADLIDGLPTEPGTEMDGDEIVAEVNANATTEIDYTKVTTIPKARIIHGEMSLNWLAFTHPASTAFQNLYRTPNTDRIKKMDFIIAVEVNQDNGVYHNGDWLIALDDNPGFTYTDTAKWLIMPYSKLSKITAALFRLHTSTSSVSGIESIGGACSANGNYSFAPNKQGISQGEASTALGIKSKALRVGEVAESGGVFTVEGDVQNSRFNMRLKTTNAVPTIMVLPSQFGFEANKVYRMDIRLLAAAQGGKKAISRDWKYLASVDSDGYCSYDGGPEDILCASDGSTLAIGTPTLGANISVTEFDAAGPPDPGIFKGLIITCSGMPNTNVFWTVNINVLEIATT